MHYTRMGIFEGVQVSVVLPWHPSHGLRESFIAMSSLQEAVIEYKKQLQKGVIQEAYRGLLTFTMALKLHFEKRFPEQTVPGNFYQGYMDMSYFAIIPDALKRRKLKIAVVLVHDTCRFEVWLAAYNKSIQSTYWRLFKEHGYTKHRVVESPKGTDSIVEHVLVENPDFSDLDGLTQCIEREVTVFIEDICEFLSHL